MPPKSSKSRQKAKAKAKLQAKQSAIHHGQLLSEESDSLKRPAETPTDPSAEIENKQHQPTSDSPYFVEVTMDGVARIDHTTPAEVRGAFSKGLQSCIAIIVTNPHRNRISLMHKSTSIKVQALDQELAWATNNFSDIENCSVTFIYHMELQYGPGLQLHLKELVTQFNRCKASHYALKPLQQKNSALGCVTVDKAGKITVQDGSNYQTIPEYDKRKDINFLNNYFLTQQEFQAGIDPDLQYHISDWTPTPRFMKSFSMMFDIADTDPRGIFPSIYSKLCTYADRLEFWFHPNGMETLKKMSEALGRDQTGTPFLRVAYVTVLNDRREKVCQVLAVSILRSWAQDKSNYLSKTSFIKTIREQHLFVSNVPYMLTVSTENLLILNTYSMVDKINISATLGSQEEREQLSSPLLTKKLEHKKALSQSLLHSHTTTTTLSQPASHHTDTEAPTPPIEITVLNQQGKEQFQRGEFEMASHTYQQAVEYWRIRTSIQATIALRNSLYMLGNSLLRNHDPHSAITPLKEAFSLQQRLLSEKVVNHDPKYQERHDACQRSIDALEGHSQASRSTTKEEMSLAQLHQRVAMQGASHPILTSSPASSLSSSKGLTVGVPPTLGSS